MLIRSRREAAAAPRARARCGSAGRRRPGRPPRGRTPSDELDDVDLAEQVEGLAGAGDLGQHQVLDHEDQHDEGDRPLDLLGDPGLAPGRRWPSRRGLGTGRRPGGRRPPRSPRPDRPRSSGRRRGRRDGPSVAPATASARPGPCRRRRRRRRGPRAADGRPSPVGWPPERPVLGCRRLAPASSSIALMLARPRAPDLQCWPHARGPTTARAGSDRGRGRPPDRGPAARRHLPGPGVGGGPGPRVPLATILTTVRGRWSSSWT